MTKVSVPFPPGLLVDAQPMGFPDPVRCMIADRGRNEHGAEVYWLAVPGFRKLLEADELRIVPTGRSVFAASGGPSPKPEPIRPAEIDKAASAAADRVEDATAERIGAARAASSSPPNKAGEMAIVVCRQVVSEYENWKRGQPAGSNVNPTKVVAAAIRTVREADAR